MKQYMLNIARRIYLNTQCSAVRKLYFNIFCSIVRNRRVESSIDGICYELDLGEIVDLSLYLKRYEPEVTEAVEKYCRSGFTVLDIGANIGAHALRIAKRVGEAGRVYAFEPTDYAYQKLVKNISLNPLRNIHPLQIALADSNRKGQHIQFRSSWPTRGSPKVRESIVDFVRLDERIDVIKLDVDGNEYPVIMGAKSVLATNRPIMIMEVWGPNFADPSTNPFRVLNELGYRFFHISTGREYSGLDELAAPVSEGGRLMDRSFSMIAKC
jgi:FkbM family methyltransferase